MQYISVAEVNFFFFIIIKHFGHMGTYAMKKERGKEIWWPRN